MLEGHRKKLNKNECQEEGCNQTVVKRVALKKELQENHSKIGDMADCAQFAF